MTSQTHKQQFTSAIRLRFQADMLSARRYDLYCSKTLLPWTIFELGDDRMSLRELYLPWSKVTEGVSGHAADFVAILAVVLTRHSHGEHEGGVRVWTYHNFDQLPFFCWKSGVSGNPPPSVTLPVKVQISCNLEPCRSNIIIARQPVWGSHSQDGKQEIYLGCPNLFLIRNLSKWVSSFMAVAFQCIQDTRS